MSVVTVLFVLVVLLHSTHPFFQHQHRNILQPEDVVQLKSLITNKDLVVLQFGTKRCRHSNHMQHILNELPQHFNSSQVSFIFLDCHSDNFTEICSENDITKYPTVKFIYLGVKMKSEYRGQRSAWALRSYVDSLLNNKVQILSDASKLDEIRPDKNHRCVIGFFSSEQNEMFLSFQKISGVFLNQCHFYAFVNEVQKIPIIAIRDSALGDEVYTGSQNLTSVFKWANQNCKPLVPEMTFENAEEIIEGKLPLLILYRNISDTESVNKFTTVVDNELKDMVRVNITAVHVDGLSFRNALKYAGKMSEDLPLIQLDTYTTYHIMQNFSDIYQPGTLKHFVSSGLMKMKQVHQNVTDNERKSIYLRLQPSKSRYSFITDMFSTGSKRDEL